MYRKRIAARTKEVAFYAVTLDDGRIGVQECKARTTWLSLKDLLDSLLMTVARLTAEEVKV